MYTTDEKYLPLAIELEERPIIFVGQNPGRTRNGKHSPYVWDGDTPTSNLLREAVEPYTNIVLTNICNYQVMTDEHVKEGLMDLCQLIDDVEPKLIICLGHYARMAIETLDLDIPSKYFRHPSYVVRFRLCKKDYITKIRKELE